MTPEQRFEQIERALQHIAENRREEDQRWIEFEKSHQDALRSHESWLLDHDRWMRDAEQALAGIIASQKRSQEELKELRELQKVTEQKLQAFIDSLRRAGNGHN
jgi:hypothetical protein